MKLVKRLISVILVAFVMLQSISAFAFNGAYLDPVKWSNSTNINHNTFDITGVYSDLYGSLSYYVDDNNYSMYVWLSVSENSLFYEETMVTVDFTVLTAEENYAFSVDEDGISYSSINDNRLFASSNFVTYNSQSTGEYILAVDMPTKYFESYINLGMTINGRRYSIINYIPMIHPQPTTTTKTTTTRATTTRTTKPSTTKTTKVTTTRTTKPSTTKTTKVTTTRTIKPYTTKTTKATTTRTTKPSTTKTTKVTTTKTTKPTTIRTTKTTINTTKTTATKPLITTTKPITATTTQNYTTEKTTESTVPITEPTTAFEPITSSYSETQISTNVSSTKFYMEMPSTEPTTEMDTSLLVQSQPSVSIQETSNAPVGSTKFNAEMVQNQTYPTYQNEEYVDANGTIQLPVPNSSFVVYNNTTAKMTKKSKITLIVSIIVAVFGIVLITTGVVLLKVKSKKDKKEENPDDFNF